MPKEKTPLERKELALEFIDKYVDDSADPEIVLQELLNIF